MLSSLFGSTKKQEKEDVPVKLDIEEQEENVDDKGLFPPVDLEDQDEIREREKPEKVDSFDDISDRVTNITDIDQLVQQMSGLTVKFGNALENKLLVQHIASFGKKKKEQMMAMGEDDRGSYAIQAVAFHPHGNLQALANSNGLTQFVASYEKAPWEFQFVTQPEQFFYELSGGFTLGKTYYNLKVATYHIIASYTQAITRHLTFGTEVSYQMLPMMPHKIGQHKSILRYSRGASCYIANLEYGFPEHAPDTLTLSYTRTATKQLDLLTQLIFQNSKQSKRWEADVRLGYSFQVPDWQSKFKALWSFTKNKVIGSVELPIAMLMVNACCKLDLGTNDFDVGFSAAFTAE